MAATSRIRLHVKGVPKPLVSQLVEAEEAERLLAEVVRPKIGKAGAISLPGLEVQGETVIAAEAIVGRQPPGRAAVGRRRGR